MVNWRNLHSTFTKMFFCRRLRGVVSISRFKQAIKFPGTERLRFFTAKKKVTALRIAAMSHSHGKRSSCALDAGFA